MEVLPRLKESLKELKDKRDLINQLTNFVKELDLEDDRDRPKDILMLEKINDLKERHLNEEIELLEEVILNLESTREKPTA